MNPLHNIDLQHLAGTRRILGIDLTANRARVVELERRGNPLNKFKPRFVVRKSFSVEFESSSIAAERSKKLDASLRTQCISARVAVASVQAVGMKIVNTIIPPDSPNIDDWIREHFEKLIRLPLSIEQVAWQVEKLDTTAAGEVVEVTFLRKSDVEECKESFRQANIELIALSAGRREAYTGYCVDPSFGMAAVFADLGDDTVSISRIQDGRRKATRYLKLEHQGDLRRHLEEFTAEDQEKKPVLLTGELKGRVEPDADGVCHPLGVLPEYALGVGLAVKGFLPEISGINFLTTEEKVKCEVVVWRSLFQRNAIALGILLCFLLGIAMIGSWVIQSRIDTLDEKYLTSGGAYAEITTLEEQVKSLEHKLRGSESTLKRTKIARVLHDVAKATPDSVWLQKLTVEETPEHRDKLLLSGFATSYEHIAEFLKRLQARGRCEEVNLVRSAYRDASETIVPIHRRESPFVSFEIRASIQE